QREGMEKVYTLVERDEVATWVKLGFAKEGNIPGFYKRSDAFLLGCSVNAPQRTNGRHIPIQSEMRIAVGHLPVPTLVIDEDDEPEIDTAAHDLAEKTLAQAKKAAKELPDKGLPNAKVTVIRELDTKKPVAAALRA